MTSILDSLHKIKGIVEFNFLLDLFINFRAFYQGFVTIIGKDVTLRFLKYWIIFKDGFFGGKKKKKLKQTALHNIKSSS